MKLRAKINIYTAFTFIVLLIVINVAIYFTFNKMMYQNEVERSHQEAIKTVNGMKDASEQVQQSDLLRAYLPINGMLRIVGANEEVDVTITTPEQQVLRDFPMQFYDHETAKLVNVNDVYHTFVSIPIIDEDGKVSNLQMMENLEDVTNILNMLKIILTIVTLIAMIPVIVSAQILSRVISKPILNMIETMTKIQQSGRHTKIDLPKKSKDELYQMGQTFNTMIERLEENYEKQEEFVMNASHELKTPLTIIESYSDLLKRRGKERPELVEESLDAIYSEAIRMRELTEQLLFLAKNESKWQLDFEEVEVIHLVKEIIQHFHSAFNTKIALHVDETIIVFADRKRLKQLIYVFVENAYKYSEGNISIAIGKTDEEHGLIEVIDDGVGIPAEDVDKIFERFYRVDKARARKTGGSGLGLAIAKEIAAVIGANVSIESEEGKGTKAKIIISLVDYH